MTRTFVAWAAMVLSVTNAQADQPADAVPATSDRLHALQEETRSAIKDLNKKTFAERRDAQKLIVESMHELQHIRNPLPPEIHDIIDPYQKDLSLEQTGHLKQIRQSVLDNQNSQPGRISSPEKAGKSLHAILEEQFSMPIITANPEIEEQMRQCFEGVDGETSSAALMRLCTQTNSIPVISNGELHLRKRRPGQLLSATNEMILLTEAGNIKGIIPIPDMAMKVDVRPDAMTFGILIQKADELVQSFFEPKKSPKPLYEVTNGIISMQLAVKPETRQLSEKEGVKIGIQNLTIISIERSEDRNAWVTTFECEIECDDLYETNEKRNQTLFDTNKYLFKDIHGNKMPTSRYPVTRLWNMRLRQTIESAQKPAEIHVRAFSDIETKGLSLP